MKNDVDGRENYNCKFHFLIRRHENEMKINMTELKNEIF